MTTFAFNSKDTYKTYRAEWKHRFLEHLKTVRTAKLGIREANRAYSKSGSIGDIWAAYSALRVAHEQTDKLQRELWAAKIEAGRQMHAAREA